MTLLPSVTNCESAKGVPVTVTGVAQVKIMTENDNYLAIACEQFWGNRMMRFASCCSKHL